MKMFYAAGAAEEIKKTEELVNRWLDTLPADVEVKHVSSAATAVTPVASSKLVTALSVTVWWTRRQGPHSIA